MRHRLSKPLAPHLHGVEVGVSSRPQQNPLADSVGYPPQLPSQQSGWGHQSLAAGFLTGSGAHTKTHSSVELPPESSRDTTQGSYN